MSSLQLENVGAVGMQFSWQIVMDNFVDVKTAAVPNVMAADTPRPATAGPLMIHLDDTGNIRPSSALSAGNTTHCGMASVDLLEHVVSRCYPCVCKQDASKTQA